RGVSSPAVRAGRSRGPLEGCGHPAGPAGPPAEGALRERLDPAGPLRLLLRAALPQRRAARLLSPPGLGSLRRRGGFRQGVEAERLRLRRRFRKRPLAARRDAGRMGEVGGLHRRSPEEAAAALDDLRSPGPIPPALCRTEPPRAGDDVERAARTG